MSKSNLIASISMKLADSGTPEELEFLRELWKSEERSSSGLYDGYRSFARGLADYEKFRVNRESEFRPGRAGK